MKLILISGARNSKKDLLAYRLANNPNVIWIKPYSNRKIPINSDVDDRFIHLNDKQLNSKLEREISVAETIVNGNRYIFFENQLKGDYVIIVGDDRIIFNLMNNWSGELVSIKCRSRDEELSSRFLLGDEEFDIIYSYEEDSFDDLLEMVL